MTNPNNIVRVRARNGGRASVYEANGWAQAFSTGILDGTGVTPNTTADMTVLVGGSSTKPDVLIAQNPAGYKIALDIVGQQGVTITAPSTNSRISSIVAYTDDLALSTTEDNTTGSPSSCGLIVVNGASAASPSAPDEATIRSAITADGAVGSQASYVVIANITVSSATTAITSTLIEKNKAGVTSQNIDWATLNKAISTAAIDDNAVTTAKIADGSITTAKLASPKIIAKGAKTIGSINPSTNVEITVDIGTTMPNNTYQVLVQKNSDGAYWSYVEYGVHNKTTTSFKVSAWSTASGIATNCAFDWVVVD